MRPVPQRQAHRRPRTGDPGTVMEALDSRRCRELLARLEDVRLTAAELRDRTDIPRSTLYRCLNRLVVAGLLEESIRIDPAGRHEHQYSRAADEVSVSLSGDGGLSVSLF